MKTCATTLKLFVGLIAVLACSLGCESTDGGSSQVSGSAYYGAEFYDPWYHGGADYPPDVIVTPPVRPVDPPHVEQPIAKPLPATSPAPRPMPSIPSMPRASFRR